MKSSKEQQHIERVQDHLLSWYRQNRRKLPWRENISGYRTWVSEIMLQQTRVEAAIPYYERFLNELPDLNIWQRQMMICFINCGKGWVTITGSAI